MNFDPLFKVIYKDDINARELSYALLRVAHTWDDLIDQDKPVSADKINTAFTDAFFTIQANKLWDASLSANLYNIYLRWQQANSIEANKESTDNDLAMAWMLRAGMYDLFILIADKLYGRAWAEEVGPHVRSFYGETLIDFIKEIRNA